MLYHILFAGVLVPASPATKADITSDDSESSQKTNSETGLTTVEIDSGIANLFQICKYFKNTKLPESAAGSKVKTPRSLVEYSCSQNELSFPIILSCSLQFVFLRPKLMGKIIDVKPFENRISQNFDKAEVLSANSKVKTQTFLRKLQEVNACSRGLDFHFLSDARR